MFQTEFHRPTQHQVGRQLLDGASVDWLPPPRPPLPVKLPQTPPHARAAHERCERVTLYGNVVYDQPGNYTLRVPVAKPTPSGRMKKS